MISLYFMKSMQLEHMDTLMYIYVCIQVHIHTHTHTRYYLLLQRDFLFSSLFLALKNSLFENFIHKNNVF